MSSEIKAIETEYKGYKFRSRLEARWAVFFDAAEIEWEYEPEGFENENGERYLPDFYLPKYDFYVEVKPPREGALEEILKACKFVGNRIKVLMVLGNIPDDKLDAVFWAPCIYRCPLTDDLIAQLVPIAEGTWESEKEVYLAVGVYSLCNMKFSTKIVCDTDFKGPRAEQTKFLTTIHHESERHDIAEDEFTFTESQNEHWEHLRNLYKKARQARFEHGEKG